MFRVVKSECWQCARKFSSSYNQFFKSFIMHQQCNTPWQILYFCGVCENCWMKKFILMKLSTSLVVWCAYFKLKGENEGIVSNWRFKTFNCAWNLTPLPNFEDEPLFEKKFKNKLFKLTKWSVVQSVHLSKKTVVSLNISASLKQLNL